MLALPCYKAFNEKISLEEYEDSNKLGRFFSGHKGQSKMVRFLNGTDYCSLDHSFNRAMTVPNSSYTVQTIPLLFIGMNGLSIQMNGMLRGTELFLAKKNRPTLGSTNLVLVCLLKNYRQQGEDDDDEGQGQGPGRPTAKAATEARTFWSGFLSTQFRLRQALVE